MNTLKLLSFTIVFLYSITGWSQKNKTGNSDPLTGISFTGGFQNPFGDLSDRFGPNSCIGFELSHKFKNNISLSLSGNFHFGSQVKEENYLQNYLTQGGWVINGNGEWAAFELTQRGQSAFLNAGYLIPVIGPNKNSGLLVKIGAGYFQHKIHVNDLNRHIPQFQGEYRKGIDRLSGGPALSQFIGYQHYSNNHMVNFYCGFQFLEALTSSLRKFNYDTGLEDLEKRQDHLIGIKAGWTFLLSKRTAREYYTN